MFATGHATIYEWSCKRRRAVAGKVVVTVDPQGYIAENWKEVPDRNDCVPTISVYGQLNFACRFDIGHCDSLAVARHSCTSHDSVCSDCLRAGCDVLVSPFCSAHAQDQTLATLRHPMRMRSASAAGWRIVGVVFARQRSVSEPSFVNRRSRLLLDSGNLSTARPSRAFPQWRAWPVAVINLFWRVRGLPELFYVTMGAGRMDTIVASPGIWKNIGRCHTDPRRLYRHRNQLHAIEPKYCFQWSSREPTNTSW